MRDTTQASRRTRARPSPTSESRSRDRPRIPRACRRALRCPARRASPSTRASASTALISRLMRAITAGGVRAGTTTPCHVVASKPLIAVSEMVGRSGSVADRAGVLTASARSRPLFTCGITEAARREHELHLAARRDRRPRPPPLYGMWTIIDARQCLEQLSGEMAGRARSGRCVVELAGFRLRERDELARPISPAPPGSRRARSAACPRARPSRNPAADRTGSFSYSAGFGREDAVVAEEPRVAVGRRARRDLRRDIAAGAAAVVDDDLLAEPRHERRRREARRRVARAPGREAQDEADRARRISVVLLRRGERARREKPDENGTARHCMRTWMAMPRTRWTEA